MSLYSMRIIKSLLLSTLVLVINCLLCLRGLLVCNVYKMVEKECKALQDAKKRVKYEQKFKTEYCDKFHCITK